MELKRIQARRRAQARDFAGEAQPPKQELRRTFFVDRWFVDRGAGAVIDNKGVEFKRWSALPPDCLGAGSESRHTGADIDNKGSSDAEGIAGEEDENTRVETRGLLKADKRSGEAWGDGRGTYGEGPERGGRAAGGDYEIENSG